MKVEFDYVAGFLFDKKLKNVALIEKQKPDWQKGKLNAIGGKIELDELPDIAMRREFREETGLDISDWKRFCILRASLETTWRVHFYFAIGDLTKIKQIELEKPICVPVSEIGDWVQIEDCLWRTIPNLSWLIPMAKNFASNLENCSEFQVIEY